MSSDAAQGSAEEVIQLRYRDRDGELTSLRAAELSDVLEALAGLTGDLARAGVFGDGPPPEVRVRPAAEGSFILEAFVTWALSNPGESVPTLSPPTVGLAWFIRNATKSIRASVKDYERDREQGTVKIIWQDDTASEVTEAEWKELNRHKRPRKKHLQKLLSPLSDDADTLEIRTGPEEQVSDEVPVFVADRADYRAASYVPDDVEEDDEEFETEAKIRALDFDPGSKWRVEMPQETRTAVMADANFRRQLDAGLAIGKDDIFRLLMRRETVIRNGRSSSTLTILEVLSHRRGGGEDDHPSEPSER